MTTSAVYWDAAAATFDDEPDHGLASPVVRAAWAARLREWIPDSGVDVLDVGCGTGSLSLLLAEQGHTVTGVDLSPNMVERARRKLGDHKATILVGDAAVPPVGDQRFDVVLCRHLLWTLPDRAAAVRRWTSLLRPGGRLVLIEGRWGPELAGLSTDALTAAVRPFVARLHVEHLTASVLWGREITDERYALLAHI